MGVVDVVDVVVVFVLNSCADFITANVHVFITFAYAYMCE